MRSCYESPKKKRRRRIWRKTWLRKHDYYGLPVLQKELEIFCPLYNKIMDEADVLVTKINEWVCLQKTCSMELTKLSSEAYSASKSKGIMEEAKRVLDKLESPEEKMKKIMKSMTEKSSCSSDEGYADGDDGDDDDDGDGNILEMVMRSEARKHGMNLSGSIRIRKVCEVQKFNISWRIMANQDMRAIILEDKEGGKEAASSVGKKAAAPAADYVAGGGSMDKEAEARETLRENAKALMTSAQETEEEMEKIREALQKLYRIKSIIEKKDRSLVEKSELITHAIKISPEPVVKKWLKKNAESKDFFCLVDLWYFINQKLGEEWKKKSKKDQERRKINLIFLAHGSIENDMIPAKCLLPLPSITDVLLYSPWNCRLSVNAAYGIATGRIKPQDRQFVCYQDPKENVRCPYSIENHQPVPLPEEWNYMRRCKDKRIAQIMVEPVGNPHDEAYEYFIALETHFGPPAADRYLIRYLASSIGRVPFVFVTLVLSLVLFFSKFEATVHLAACLGKYPKDAVMDEKYLKSQYAYTVDNTLMTVPLETIKLDVFNMFRAVFGDVVPSSNR